jgi:hypothetical protein
MMSRVDDSLPPLRGFGGEAKQHVERNDYFSSD